MNNTHTSTSKINDIALQVMVAVNSDREDHTKTMELLTALQNAIREANMSKMTN
jgi:hypothetical protein